MVTQNLSNLLEQGLLKFAWDIADARVTMVFTWPNNPGTEREILELRFDGVSGFSRTGATPNEWWHDATSLRTPCVQFVKITTQRAEFHFVFNFGDISFDFTAIEVVEREGRREDYE